VADALINGGADIETPGGSIGTPLANAVGYGCWHVARLLVGRGARADELWQAAALGMMPRIRELLASDAGPTGDDVSEAFWQACHGGQRRVAEHLLGCGANLNATPGYSDQTPADIARPSTRAGRISSPGCATTAQGRPKRRPDLPSPGKRSLSQRRATAGG
jgi:hypothetical protein